MKCPDCGTELAPARRHGVQVDACPSCKGLWLNAQELDQLEDAAFELGDQEKGTLVFATEPSTRACPECGQSLQGFQYRLYDLPLEFCAQGHGYFLDAGEDERVIALMREEERRLKRSDKAEDRWAAHLKHLRSGTFFEKLRDLLR
jgi:Zn-finger nucleic acid-binding protein